MIFFQRNRVKISFASHPIKWLVGGTLVSLFFSLGFGEAAKLMDETHSAWTLTFFLVSWGCSFIVPAVILIYSIYGSFFLQSRAKRFSIILLSYSSLILVFAGLYYSLAVWGDHSDAVEEYYYYHAHNPEMMPQDHKIDIFPYKHARPFRGFDTRLWSSVEDNLPWHISKKSLYNPPTEYWAWHTVVRSMEWHIKFRPEARLSLILDCLHLSIITMTTVGYGDISPALWYSKLAVDIQALTGIMLFVVALGLLLSDKTVNYPDK
jgi:hypothetical protein